MSNESKITTELLVDDPLEQDASFRDDFNYRRYVDNQIRGTQEHVVSSLLSGQHATWFRLSGSSAVIDAGDVVCTSTDAPTDDIPVVTKAVAAALVDARTVGGVALETAAPGGRVRVALSGSVVAPSITQLLEDNAGAVIVNTTTGRCERATSIGPSDFCVGTVDDSGYLTVQTLPKLELLGFEEAEGRTYTLSNTSAAVAPPNCVCIDPTDLSGQTVTKATLTALQAAGVVLGIAEESASPGGTLTVAIGGLVGNSVTGLGDDASSKSRLAAVNTTTSNPMRVTSPDGSEFELGAVDRKGNVTVDPHPNPRTSPLKLFNVRHYGAVGDSDMAGGGTDDLAAFQAADAAAADFLGPGGATNSRGIVFVPPGRYRLANRWSISSSVMGVEGSLYASSILCFDKDVGERVGGSAVDEGGLLVVKSGFSSPSDPGDGLTIENIYIKQASGGDPFKLCHGIKVIGANCALGNLFIDSPQGDGIHIVGDSIGGNANACHLFGKIRIASPGRYGILIHGSDASALCSSATVLINGAGSYGLYDASFLGSYWAHLDLEGNGIYVHASLGDWFHGDTDFSSKEWSSLKAVSYGEIVLPPVANKTGFQYRVTTLGGGNLGASQPTWPTTLGNTVGNGTVTLECWMEEGGQGKCAVNSSFGFIYAESDQQLGEWGNNCSILGTGGAGEVKLGYVPKFGVTGRGVLPFEAYNRQAFNDGTLDYPILFGLGGPSTAPGRLLFFDASYGTDNNPTGWKKDYGTGLEFLTWDPVYQRYRSRVNTVASYQQNTGFTLCGGRSLPQPGAFIPGSVWLGGALGFERRYTTITPTDDDATVPAFDPTSYFARGAYDLNSIIWSTGIDELSAERPWPVGWRCKKKFGYPSGLMSDGGDGDQWVASETVYPGTVITPDSLGATVAFRARNKGITHSTTEPTWTDTPGASFTDNPGANQIIWDWWGTSVPSAGWDPLIVQSPVMLSKSVGTGGTTTMTEDESAHERIKLTGALSSGATVVMTAGPATGFVRTFWNATTNAFTVTIKGSSGDTGVTIEQGYVTTVFSDGTNAKIVKVSTVDILGSGTITNQPLVWNGTAWAAGTSLAFTSGTQPSTGHLRLPYNSGSEVVIIGVKDSGGTDRAFLSWGGGDLVAIGNYWNDIKNRCLAFQVEASSSGYIQTPSFTFKDYATATYGIDFTLAAGFSMAFKTASTSITVGQNDNTTNSATGAKTFYFSQSCTGTTSVGGDLELKAGDGTTRAGSCYMSLGTTAEAHVEVCEPASGRRVVALCNGAKITTTEMPTNSGDRVVYVANAATAPTANPASGGILYAEGGAGKWRSSGGTTTTFGTADPHCPRCGMDFAMQWDNPNYGGELSICMPCLLRTLVKLGGSLDDVVITNEVV